MSQESRRRGMSHLSEDAARCAEVGKLLGRLCREHYAGTYNEFVNLVTQPPHPLMNLVVNLAYTRSPLRLEGGGSLLEELQRQPLRKRTPTLLREAWSMYRTLRQHAAARGP